MIESKECLLSFGADSLYFKLAKNIIDKKQKYKISCCYVCVWNLVAYIFRGTLVNVV
jgi:hypothetical protein